MCDTLINNYINNWIVLIRTGRNVIILIPKIAILSIYIIVDLLNIMDLIV